MTVCATHLSSDYFATLPALEHLCYTEKLRLIHLPSCPFSLPTSNWSNDPTQLPEMTYPDMYSYLIEFPGMLSAINVHSWCYIFLNVCHRDSWFFRFDWESCLLMLLAWVGGFFDSGMHKPFSWTRPWVQRPCYQNEIHFNWFYSLMLHEFKLQIN